MLPDLSGRLELSALRYATEADHDRRRVFGSGGIERSTAFGTTKHLRSTISALCRLHIAFRLAFQDEAFNRCSDHGAKRRPGQHLAIRTVAHHYAGRIDIGQEGNGTAMTGTVDSHDGGRDAALGGRHGVEPECW